MEDHSPNIQDPQFPNDSSGKSSIIIGIIVLLFMIAGSVFIFIALPQDEEENYTSAVPIATYSVSSPVTIAPVHSSATAQTYLKLGVIPDQSGKPLEQQAQACARILSKKFSTLTYPVSISTDKGLIELIIYSTDPEHIRQVISFINIKGKLSIHLVHRKTNDLANQVASGQKAVPGYSAMPHQTTDPATGITSIEQLLIRDKKEITDEDVKFAHVSPRDYSIVNIELTATGGKKMEAFTLSLTPSIDRMATVFDGNIKNYATLNAERLGRHFVITGLDSKEEAEKLVRAIQSPLPNNLKVIEQRPHP